LNRGASTQVGIAARLEKLLGPGLVREDPALVQRFGVDAVTPQVVIQPETSEQICAALRLANEENWIVVPFGGGTRQRAGHTLERVDVVLSTERLQKIECYDPGDLTISLQAGVSITHAIQTCAGHRQLLPVEAPEGATIGGALAAADAGPLRAGFGSLRDFCIGISFITGDGAIGRGGGRVVKNVAGYDLMKLMIGSYGSLGVIISANFKLFPLPQQTMTGVCQFESLAEAMKFRDWLLKSPLTPLSAEIVSPSALEYLSDTEPRDPDHWAPDSDSSKSQPKWEVIVRFAGSERVLARCRRELGSSVTCELSGAEEADLWRRVVDFERRVTERHRNVMIFQVNVAIAESQPAIEAAQVAATDYNFLAAVVGRATVGSYVVAFLPLAIDPPSVTQFASAASDFRSRLSKASSAVAVCCPREAKQHFDVWGSTPTDIDLMQKIKRALDPKGILNRGRFLAG
jgi:glycolate oxidase FAD binding subunit